MACSDNNNLVTINKYQKKQQQASQQQEHQQQHVYHQQNIIDEAISINTIQTTINTSTTTTSSNAGIITVPVSIPPTIIGGIKKKRSRVPESLLATAAAMLKVLGLSSSTRRTKNKETKANKVRIFLFFYCSQNFTIYAERQ